MKTKEHEIDAEVKKIDEINPELIEKQDPTKDIIAIIEGNNSDEEIKKQLDEYHDNDIANAIQELSPSSRKKLYKILGVERVSDIFAYIDDVSLYLEELSMEKAADVLENMDSDDAAAALENVESKEKKEKLLSLMDKDVSEDVRLIASYDEGTVGSKMTTNYVAVKNSDSVKMAMKSVIKQSEENDNISTIYVTDKDGIYCGAMDLRDLILAREGTKLEDVYSKNYPYLMADQKISDCIEDVKDYAEDSLPVLDNDKKIIGVITSQDIVEVVDEELGEDYAKLAGLTEQEDLKETLLDSMKKRIPWLVLLLFLGLGVSSVVGIFEPIVAQISIVICFQSLILDMAGNVGTQSLAVTIRVLMDENVSGKEKLLFVLKEMKVGAANGLLLGSLTFVFTGIYLHFFKNYPWISATQISGCIGTALFCAMVISSLVGTIIPMFFHKIKVDPAVASGPLITTINDLVAVITYYGLSWALLLGRI